jgi:hypothetical protein
VVGDRLEDQTMIKVAEESLNVQIDRLRVPPAPLPQVAAVSSGE